MPADAKLTPRPEELPAWDSLSADQKKLFARMAEVYAAALSHADHNIGRVVDAIAQLGELNNTLITRMSTAASWFANSVAITNLPE